MSTNLAFYGLQERPFNPTPDPRFLYLTPGHQEALAQLLYAVQERKGFMLLTGEIGTGKTTLLQALLRRLDGNTRVVFIANSMLSFSGILEHVFQELGIRRPGKSHSRWLFTLQNSLIERWHAGHNTVLILDEAQHLDCRTLEQVRLLSNFETPTEKILQIILVGQPELRTKLELAELRQLKQRIALRCGLPPLTHDEIRDYIRTRLRIAGSRDLGLFTDRAVARIAAYSGGIPRLVNTVCDHCLLIGYADQIRRIDRDTVAEAIEYLEKDERASRTRLRLPRGWRTFPLGWRLLAASVAAAAGLWFAGAGSHALARALDMSASSLPDLARSARTLFGP